MGSFLSRALLVVFGYAYPAYKCFKTVEKDEPQIEELLFWCQYWILVASATICERLGDTFISWLPLYNEAKLAFFIYLWHGKTEGTTYIYNYVCRNFLAKHEAAIDRSLMELRNKAGDIAVMSWQKATSCSLTRIFETLQSLQTLPQIDQMEQRSDSGRQSEAEHGTKSLTSSAMVSGDDGAKSSRGRQFSENSDAGLDKARESNTILHNKMPSEEDEKLNGSPPDGEGRKTGMFRAALNRLRRRKSPH